MSGNNEVSLRKTLLRCKGFAVRSIRDYGRGVSWLAGRSCLLGHSCAPGGLFHQYQAHGIKEAGTGVVVGWEGLGGLVLKQLKETEAITGSSYIEFVLCVYGDKQEVTSVASVFLQ